MYTRDFFKEGSDVKIPLNYDGTALVQDLQSDNEAIEKCEKIEENKESSPSWSDKIGIKSILPRFKEFFPREFKLGSEELIIIGIIVFLLFTKSADLESIIILAALLFI